MTVEESTDASFNGPLNWKAIVWPKVEQIVWRLQLRIAKATKEGRHRDAKALQWMLTHSRSAKLLAVRRVTTNAGAKTPGVDNQRWRTEPQKLHGALNLKRHGYKALPLRRHYIPKKNGKMRPLSIPTLRDRSMQALHALALAPIAETLGDKNSYGFREGRRCADALEQCHTLLSRKCSPAWVLEGDIKACFDEIGHGWLLQHVPMDGQILAQWLKAGYMEKSQLFPTQAGTPQGGIISPILANLTLDGLEQAVKAVARTGDKVNFVRYADDFIVTGATREILEQKVKPALTAFLSLRGLRLSEQKTVITHTQMGFNFLGHTVRKYGDKLVTRPSKSSLQALLGKVRECIQTGLATQPERLIHILNPILRGWANYYQHSSAKRTFNKVDHEVFQALWRWTKRRHSAKSAKWRRRKYFSAAGNWIFAARLRQASGEDRIAKVYQMASTPVARYVKVRGDANPYDPKDTEYFRQRRCYAWRIRGRARNGSAKSKPAPNGPAAACSRPEHR
jgi:RNA-directed DNA polymerase